MQPFGLETIIGELAAIAPVALIWLAGLVIAVVTWRWHPRVSLLVVIGLVVLGLATLAGIFVSTSLPLLIHTRTGMDFTQISRIVFTLRLAQAIISAIGWGLIVAAVFAGRK